MEEPTLPESEVVVTEESRNTNPRTGEMAPDFTLPDSNGIMVNLVDSLNDNQMVVLVFYHEYT